MMKKLQPTLWGIVPAAGIGSRFESKIPKQYAKVAGKTILEHSVSALLSHAGIEQVIISLAQEDTWFEKTPLAKHANLQTVTGGSTRMQSVLNALQALSDKARPLDWVLVHDAARPCLSRTALTQLIESCYMHTVGGILASPVSATVKQINTQQHIIQTLNRNTMSLAQTPQMFRYEILLNALTDASARKKNVTDESQAVELFGYCPKVVKNLSPNLKLTYPYELKMIETLLTEKR